MALRARHRRADREVQAQPNSAKVVAEDEPVRIRTADALRKETKPAAIDDDRPLLRPSFVQLLKKPAGVDATICGFPHRIEAFGVRDLLAHVVCPVACLSGTALALQQ